jgi:hypothetical protein
VVIGNDCTGSCKSNYHTITTTTALYFKWNNILCKCIYDVYLQIHHVQCTVSFINTLFWFLSKQLKTWTKDTWLLHSVRQKSGRDKYFLRKDITCDFS